MLIGFITYWWPIILTVVFITIQAMVSMKRWVVWSFVLSLLFTAFTIFAFSFFNLVVILVFVCFISWAIPLVTYFTR
ncbi:hypothetical protein UACE39S_02506 [Ureibacillus acetophenoni]